MIQLFGRKMMGYDDSGNGRIKLNGKEGFYLSASVSYQLHSFKLKRRYSSLTYIVVSISFFSGDNNYEPHESIYLGTSESCVSPVNSLGSSLVLYTIETISKSVSKV